MAIENTKIAAARPTAFEVGFGDVHDDGDAVLIIVLDQSMEGVDCIPFDGSIRSFYESDRLYARYSYSFFFFLVHTIIFNDYF